MTKFNTEIGATQATDHDRLVEAVLRVGAVCGFVVEHRNRLGWNERGFVQRGVPVRRLLWRERTAGPSHG